MGPLTHHDAFDVTKVADEAAHVLDIRGAMSTRDNDGCL